MSLVEELEKLERLRRDGALTDDEFTRAKARLLSGDAAPALGEHLAEVRLQNELARLDREWEIERRMFLVYGRYGPSSVPTKALGVGTAVLGGLFGVLWLAMAVAITSGAPDFGPFVVAKYVFPLFGLVFITAAIGGGIYVYSLADKHDAAFRAYQERRAKATPGATRE